MRRNVRNASRIKRALEKSKVEKKAAAAMVEKQRHPRRNEPLLIDVIVTDDGDDNTPNKYKTLEEIPEPLEYRVKFEDVVNGSDGHRENGSYINPYLWKPGQTGNPHNKGRGKSAIKEIGERIAVTKAKRALTEKQKLLAKDLGYNTDEITVIEALMMDLATSSNPLKIALFLERTYGKVPNINLNAQLSEGLVQRFKSKLTDAELEAITEGADVFEILADKLPDADGGDDNAGTVMGDDGDDNVVDASSVDVT